MDMQATISVTGRIFKGDAPAVINKSMTALMYKVVAFLERAVKARTPRGVFGAQGGLLGSIQGEVQGKGTPTIKGTVFHGSKHGDVVEKGRTAGKAMPPAGTLVRWLEVKLGLSEKQAQRIEYVVRRKIAKKGFAGAYMFERAWTEHWPYIQRMFEQEGFEIAKELSE
ncbi:MAG: hypothetical protein HZB62_10775 [Nitrospirae bacterium]|nr:hypothetical protein [Nitrospirota bacterium]